MRVHQAALAVLLAASQGNARLAGETEHGKFTGHANRASSAHRRAIELEIIPTGETTPPDQCAERDGRSQFPYMGKDSGERLLLREGVIDEIPSSLCGSTQGKNVILVVGDGMGWEMVRAGAIGKRVVDELKELGCDIATGCADTNITDAAREAFQGRTLDDYYTEGAGEGLSFQELPNFSLVTTTATLLQEPEKGNHYSSPYSLLKGKLDDHENGMAPLALDECGFPIDFSPLDWTEGGNMVLWNSTKGGQYPWDPRYYQDLAELEMTVDKSADFSGFDPTYIMQHATDSASTAGTLATGHKAARGMMSLDLYEEKVSTLVEDAMMCGKAGGVVTSVPVFHATPGSFIIHTNSRSDRDALRKSFLDVNPTYVNGVCGGGYYPEEDTLESMRSGALSSQWTLLEQQEGVLAADFYNNLTGLDPDNGDHVFACMGGDFTKSGESNLPYRGIDSTYTNRHCDNSEVIKDPDTGLPISITLNTTVCNHYEPEEKAQIPDMKDNVKASLDFLSRADEGFFLMYEQGDVDWAAHANHMDDMLGAMLDMDDSVREIMNWIESNGGFEKNSLYVTADHDHYLTLEDGFPEALANFLIEGKSHMITPMNNSAVNPWSTAIDANRHEDDSKSQVEHISDFATWTADDLEAVQHFWGARGSGGNGWGSHSTRPVPLFYDGDDGCIEQLTGKDFQVVGRTVKGVDGMIDQMHIHACMLKNLFGLGVPEPIDMAEPNLDIRVPVQLGPRPYFALAEMKDSKLKTDLAQCANEKKLFALSDFSVGHRGAPLQFPEHTAPSYGAASLMGAGLVECDVTFTADLELVCRHAQCDLHTTTDVVTRPELNAKCTTPWAPGVTPECCASDFTLEEIKTLCAKMDSSGSVDSETAEGYAFGGTADFRTDLYQQGCPEVLTHKESIAIIKANGSKFIPEAKAPSVTMPFNDFTQEDFAAKIIQDYVDMKISPEDVWLQSNTMADIEYWLTTDFGAQALLLDFDDDREVADDEAFLDEIAATGVKFFGPPMWKLVVPNPDAGKDIYTPDMMPSAFAEQATERNLTMIPWTLSRTGGPIEKDSESVDYYWQTLQGQGLNLTEGSLFDLLDVLYKDVGVAGIFDDWAAMSSFYANCMDIALRIF